MNQSLEMISLEGDITSGSANDIRKPGVLSVVIAIAMLLETVLILVWVLRKANYGFDLSDESFYMVRIERPLEYPISATQFGSVLAVPFAWLGSDLTAFRQFNIVTTYGLSLVVACQLLGRWLRNFGCTMLIRLAVAAAFALPSLTVMTYWLMTPSYNSLNGVAFLLVCTAVFSNAKTERYQLWSAVLIGFGGYLSFMAKPTSAAVLGVMVLGFVWGIQRWGWRSLIIAVFTAGSVF